MRRTTLAVVWLLLASCVATFADLAYREPGRAILAHLKNQGDDSVCFVGTHLAVIDGIALRQLAGGARESFREQFAIDSWQRCVVRLAADLRDGQRALFQDELADVFAESLEQKELYPATLRALRVVHRAMDARPVSKFVALLPRIEARAASGAEAAELDRWREVLELESGVREGAAVTEQTIASVSERGLLLDMVTWLPSESLRSIAKARYVEVSLREGEYAELLDDLPAMIERTVRLGFNPVDLGRYRPARIDFDPPVQLVLAPDGRFAHYFLVPVGSRKSVLHGLRYSLQAVARPLRACVTTAKLDPTPCIHSKSVTVAAGRLDGEGVRLSEVPRARALDIAKARTFDLVMDVAGLELTTTLPVSLSTRRHMVLGAPQGRDASDVDVMVRTVTAQTVHVEARAGGAVRDAFVPLDAFGTFRLVSRGGAGIPGRDGDPGRSGDDGDNGESASCPKDAATNGGAGGAGQRGGDGGPGGNGGDGGDITVHLDCRLAACPGLRARLLGNFSSEGGSGGAGGPGGSGGRGGDGGSGGSGASCDADGNEVGFFAALGGDAKVSYSIDAGDDGPDGPDGPPGRSGRSGASGRRGKVRFARASRAEDVERRVVVYVLDAVRAGSVAEEVAIEVTERLLVASGAWVNAVGSKDLDALLSLENKKDMLGCQDVQCFAEIAGSLGADAVLRTSIGRHDDTFVVHLSLIDVIEARAQGRTNGSYTSSQEMLRAVDGLAKQLFDTRQR